MKKNVIMCKNVVSKKLSLLIEIWWYRRFEFLFPGNNYLINEAVDDNRKTFFISYDTNYLTHIRNSCLLRNQADCK